MKATYPVVLSQTGRRGISSDVTHHCHTPQLQISISRPAWPLPPTVSPARSLPCPWAPPDHAPGVAAAADPAAGRVQLGAVAAGAGAGQDALAVLGQHQPRGAVAAGDAEPGQVGAGAAPRQAQLCAAPAAGTPALLVQLPPGARHVCRHRRGGVTKGGPLPWPAACTPAPSPPFCPQACGGNIPIPTPSQCIPSILSHPIHPVPPYPSHPIYPT